MPVPPNGSRPVFVSGVGRIPHCRTCGQPDDQCRCRAERGRASGPATQLPRDGIVRLLRESKGRGGKPVTLVVGLPDDPALLRELASALKKLCATGGTVRGNVIELQGGDVREKIRLRLEALGYRVRIAGG